MAKIWKKAREKVGEDIDMYSGLKHSSEIGVRLET
jgi:hypothetical protein